MQKARIELRRSLDQLNEAKKTLPYNFELALVAAEVQLVVELMILASKSVMFRAVAVFCEFVCD